MYKRHYFNIIKSRISESRKFIQVITGPRQVGKTTLVLQVIEAVKIPSIYESADAMMGNDALWINNIWERARLRLREPGSNEVLLCLDEVQKIDHWSEHIKREWDRDSREHLNIKVILLGSSWLLLMEGLTESLAGRFETISMTHWKFNEMNSAFGTDVEDYAWFGGYPGAVELIGQEDRWRNYIRESLIETAISKDIFMMNRINKPALLKRLFEIGACYSGQILSYTKILGQLQDAGNTVTLSHYMDMISKAGLIGALDKFSIQKVRQRASSPKFQVFNPAIYSAYSAVSFRTARSNPQIWGRVVESAVGAHLLNCSRESDYMVLYWREKHMEVDFILLKDNRIIALEVKSGLQKSVRGLDEFNRLFQPFRSIVVGPQGIPLEEFLLLDPTVLFE